MRGFKSVLINHAVGSRLPVLCLEEGLDNDSKAFLCFEDIY